MRRTLLLLMVFALTLVGACIIGPKQDDPAGADFADTGAKDPDSGLSDDDAFTASDVGSAVDVGSVDSSLPPATDAIADTGASDAVPSDGAASDGATDAASDGATDALTDSSGDASEAG